MNKTITNFLKELQEIDYLLSCRDHVWKVLFKENVFDVAHYDDFGRSKRGIAPFINWESLPILKPIKLYQSVIVS